MGNYTELVCAFELRDAPREVLNTLMYMTDQDDDFEEENVPNHKLFEDGSRWRFMLRSDSYYFEGITNSTLTVDNLIPNHPSYYLTVRCNLKNYSNEIENFIDWLRPYIHKDKENMFIGYKRYEYDDEPTLIYV